MVRLSLKRVLLIVAMIPLVGLLAVLVSSIPQLPALGSSPSGATLSRIKGSAHYADGKFVDILPRSEMDTWKITKAWFTDGSAHRFPDVEIPLVPRKAADFANPPASGLRVTWLGHSTLLVEIEDTRILFDPVWGPRASPFWWTGVSRFYDPPLPFDELPRIDAVVISHDHYDHLDYPTMLELAKLEVPFIVPLGVDSHLEGWGIPRERIAAFDWWEETKIGDLRVIATPARHFSGRGLFDRETTLWAGWALVGKERRFFYSGDTALFPQMEDIGERLGPFDVTCLEAGAYNALWADVHLGPEQAVVAHRMLKGNVLIPVHWGLFDLAMHGWTEPMERVLAAANKADVKVATPRPGESIEPTEPLTTEKWWPTIPFQTAQEAPVTSSHL